MSNTAVRGQVSGADGQATALLGPVEGHLEEEYLFASVACSWITDDHLIDTGPPTGVTIETVVDADGTVAVRSSLPDAVNAGHVLVPEADACEAAVLEQFGGTS